MHPYLFGKIPSYSVMMIIGILAAVLLFRFLCAKKRVPGKIYDYYATAAIVSIAVGLGSAFLFQAVYNLIDTGKFEFRGLTFMGGLIGGSVTFVLFGLLSKKTERKAQSRAAARSRARRALHSSRPRNRKNRLFPRRLLLRQAVGRRRLHSLCGSQSHPHPSRRSRVSVRPLRRTSVVYAVR